MHSPILVALLGLVVLSAQEPQPPSEPEAGIESPSEPAPEPPVRFLVRVLPDLRTPGCDAGEEAVAIDAQGRMVGTVCRQALARAASWSAEGDLILIDASEEGPDSVAIDIDEEGTVLGFARGDEPRPFLWTAEEGLLELDLPPGAHPLALGAERTVAFSHPGGAHLAGGTWRPGTEPVALVVPGRDVLVRDLSRAGVVTGIVGGGETPARAFRWSPGGELVELAVPAGFTHTHGNAIEDSGLVVGLSRAAARDQATLWAPDAGPALLPYVDSEHTYSAALGVNARGWVVGYEHAGPNGFPRARAVVWIDGVAWELDRLLLPTHGAEVHVTVAWDVNEQGQIAARGTYGGVQRAMRLDPE